MIQLTEADKRLLQEDFLGEVWHEIRCNMKPSDIHVNCSCCENELVLAYLGHRNRPFNTPEDFFALRNKIVEIGKGDEFASFLEMEYDRDSANVWVADFWEWVTDMERFPCLVRDAIKEGVLRCER